MPPSDTQDFATWLLGELETRGWSRAELARRAGISAAVVDQIVNGMANPGLKVCQGIARAFNMPLEDTLRLAGILPSLEDEPTLASRWRRLSALPIAQRQQVLDLLDAALTLAYSPVSSQPTQAHTLAELAAWVESLPEPDADEVLETVERAFGRRAMRSARRTRADM